MKNVQRPIAWMVAVCVLISSIPLMMVSAAYENTYVCDGDQKKDILAVATTQIGYAEGSLDGSGVGQGSNYTKYGVWYDSAIGAGDGIYESASWDLMFLAWCADQANIPTDIILKGNTVPYVPYVCSAFQNEGQLEMSAAQGGDYVPLAGDLIFFKSAGTTLPTHIGIVRYVADERVYTIEGNTTFASGEPESEGVAAKSYNLANSNIYAYATPTYTVADYANTYANTGDERTDLVEVAKTQMGYQPADDGTTKYDAWYADAADGAVASAGMSWEATFLSWCADQADIGDEAIPCVNTTAALYEYYVFAQRVTASASQGGTDAPRVGDIAFLKTAALSAPAACGVVSAVDETAVTLICGNVTDGSLGRETVVAEKVYGLSDDLLYAYASPDYGVNDRKAILTIHDTAYTMKDGVLSGVQPGTTVEELLATLSGGTLGVYNSAIPYEEGVVGTGQSLYVYHAGYGTAYIALAVRGDADGDGDNDTADARAILRGLVGDTLTNAQKRACDMDTSGTVTTSDARQMLKAVAA